MSELSNKGIKITMINIFKTLIKKIDRMQKQMVNLHRQSKTYGKKMLTRITVSKMFVMAFISGFQVHSLKVGQYKILKLKDKRKKKEGLK